MAAAARRVEASTKSRRHPWLFARSSRQGGSFADLLQPYTDLTVREAHAGAPLEPNTVLVLPAGKDLDALDSRLHLVPAPQNGAARAHIDRAFRVAAAAYDGRSVGVLLTGAGSDGSLGLAQIKSRGGLAIAQDPDEAEHAEGEHKEQHEGPQPASLRLSRELPDDEQHEEHERAQPEGQAELGDLLFSEAEHGSAQLPRAGQLRRGSPDASTTSR